MQSAAPWRREHVVHVVVQPGGLPELDRPAHPAGHRVEELGEALDVPLPARRQLDQRRTTRRPEALDAVEVVLQPRLRVTQLHPV